MAKGYISNRQKNLKVGISSYTEDTTTLSVVGKVGIGTDNASADLDVRGDINVTGIITATSFYGEGSNLSGVGASTANYATSAGIATLAQNLTGSPSINVTNINAVDASFTGNVSIAGTLTYDDVTNIDAIGLVTARSGIDIGYPGTATTLTADGNAVFSGIVTAAQFFGDGSGLDGVTGVNIVAQEVTGDPVYPTFASNVGVTTLGIAQTGFVYVPSTGSVGIGSTQPGSTLTVSAPSGYTGNLLDLNTQDGAPLKITNPQKGQFNIETYETAGSFGPTLSFRFGPGGGNLTNHGIGIWPN